MKEFFLAAVLFFLASSVSAFAEPRAIPMDQPPSRQGDRLILGQPTDGSRVAEVHVWHKNRSKASIYTDLGQATCPEGDWFNFKDDRRFWQQVDQDSPTGPGVRTKCDYHPPSNPDEVWCSYWCVSGAGQGSRMNLDLQVEGSR